MSQLSEMQVAVFATLRFPEGGAAAAIAPLQKIIDAFRAHDGFIAYDLSQDCADPDILRVAEQWTTQDCLTRHAAHRDVDGWHATLRAHDAVSEQYVVCTISAVDVITRP